MVKMCNGKMGWWDRFLWQWTHEFMNHPKLYEGMEEQPKYTIIDYKYVRIK